MNAMHLEIAARKQGLRSLGGVDFAALEPGGGICFVAKQPMPHEEHLRAIFARLDEISAEVKALRKGSGIGDRGSEFNS